jgi:hypothetical protein
VSFLRMNRYLGSGASLVQACDAGVSPESSEPVDSNSVPARPCRCRMRPSSCCPALLLGVLYHLLDPTFTRCRTRDRRSSCMGSGISTSISHRRRFGFEESEERGSDAESGETGLFAGFSLRGILSC